MGEHHDELENQPTHEDSGAAANPQSDSPHQGTRAGPTAGAAGSHATAAGLAGHSSGTETAAGTGQPNPQGIPAGAPYMNPMPPWQYAAPGAATTPQSRDPGSPGESHVAAGDHGHHSGNPGPMSHTYGYPPYVQIPPQYYTVYPGGHQGASQVPPHGGAGMHARQPDMNQLITDIANGGSNSLSSLGQIINFDDKEFWKGALIGAAAVLLLTNDSVQRTLFRAGSKAKQAVKSGVEKVKEVAGEEHKASEEKKATDK